MHILTGNQPQGGECLTPKEVELLGPSCFIPLARYRLMCAVGYFVDDLQFAILTHYVPCVVDVNTLIDISLSITGLEKSRFLSIVTRTEKELRPTDTLKDSGV